MEKINRDLEYFVDELIKNLERYFSLNGAPSVISEHMVEIKRIRAGGNPSDYEQWVVSERAKVVHLWTYLSGYNETLCGKYIHSDGHRVFLNEQSYSYVGYKTCKRCTKWQLRTEVNHELGIVISK